MCFGHQSPCTPNLSACCTYFFFVSPLTSPFPLPSPLFLYLYALILCTQYIGCTACYANGVQRRTNALIMDHLLVQLTQLSVVCSSPLTSRSPFILSPPSFSLFHDYLLAPRTQLYNCTSCTGGYDGNSCLLCIEENSLPLPTSPIPLPSLSHPSPIPLLPLSLSFNSCLWCIEETMCEPSTTSTCGDPNYCPIRATSPYLSLPLPTSPIPLPSLSHPSPIPLPSLSHPSPPLLLSLFPFLLIITIVVGGLVLIVLSILFFILRKRIYPFQLISLVLFSFELI